MEQFGQAAGALIHRWALASLWRSAPPDLSAGRSACTRLSGLPACRGFGSFPLAI